MRTTSSNTTLESPKTFQTILVLLGVAAALPLLPTGMFAGLALALLVAIWLVRAGTRVRNHLVLWVLAASVLLENGAFVIGYLT